MKAKMKLKDVLGVIDIGTKVDVFYYFDGAIHEVSDIDLRNGVPDCLDEFLPSCIENIKNDNGKIEIEVEGPKKIRKSELLALMRQVDNSHRLELSYKGSAVASITEIDKDYAYADESDAAEAIFDNYFSDYAEDYYVFSNQICIPSVTIELRFDFARIVKC